MAIHNEATSGPAFGPRSEGSSDQRANIASRLRTARENCGLSQGQVARHLNMHRPTISEIEAGRRKVPSEELATFASLYGVSVAWISGEQEGAPQIEDRVQLVAREISKLKSSDIDRLIDLLQAVKSGEDNQREGKSTE